MRSAVRIDGSNGARTYGRALRLTTAFIFVGRSQIWPGSLLPPLRAGQCKLYFEGETCSAFVTWALLSCELSSRLMLRFEDPQPDQWTSGDQLWIIDMVGPGKAFEVARDLKRTIFAERVEPAYALRRDATGAVRKIARWDPRNGG